MVLLTLEAPRDVIASYTQPGQYFRLAYAGENGYFVQAAPPGASTWQILLREGGVADKLLEAPIGVDVAVSRALGAGFPNASARGRPLLLLLGGTGAAAARAVVPTRIATGDAEATEVYLGFRRLADVPMRSELSSWASSGVGVVVCLSRDELAANVAPSASKGDVPLHRGYVQEVLRARGRSHAGLVFVVGPAGLVEGAKRVADELGVRSEDVHTNV
jgi:NAD(P)H-flavin reductase